MRKNKYTKPITTTLATLLLLSAMGCTQNFAEYNSTPDEPTLKDLTRSKVEGLSLSNLINWIIPNQENGYQMSFSLVGGPYSGFAGNTGFVDDYSTYAPRENWKRYSYTDTYPGHLYNHFFAIAVAADKDLSKPYYALACILRTAITHWVSDIYGPLPYSQITGKTLNAPYDTQKELYTHFLEDLKKATEALDAVSPTDTKYKNYDAVYDGNMQKWAKYGRSLMLRMAIRISGVSPDMAKEYGEWAISKGVITQNEDNAMIKSIDNPLYKIEHDWSDTRVGADVVEYLNAFKDPRKEKMLLPGSDKTHPYVGVRTTAKNLKSDGDTRNKYASYNIKKDSPIYLLTASEVAFLKAEAKLLGWNVGEGSDAKALYEEGIKLSFKQWNASGVEEYLQVETTRKGFNDPFNKDASLPDFSSAVTVKWDAAGNDVSKQKAMIATQKWLALYPYNTIEAWSEWRRTGYPNLMPAYKNSSAGRVEDIKQVNGRDRGGMRRLSFAQSEYNDNKDNIEKAVLDLGGEDSPATDLWWAKETSTPAQ